MDTNIIQLAQDLAQHLFTSTTAYAALKEVGKGASNEIGKKLIGSVTGQTHALLKKLWPKIEKDPAAVEAIKALGQKSDNQDLRSALELQLTKLFEEDQEWAQEIAQLLRETKTASIENRSVVIKGDVTYGTIILGDHNQVK